MIPRSALLDAVRHETAVCKHLASKISDEGFEYRPSDKQRTTLDLMRYLALCMIGPAASMVSGDWSEYSRREEALGEMGPEDFGDALDRQLAEFEELVDSLSDEDLAEKIVRAPGAGELPLGVALMRTAYAWMVAYRHELFLRAKATGATEINTANNWAGVDWKPKEEAASSS